MHLWKRWKYAIPTGVVAAGAMACAVYFFNPFANTAHARLELGVPTNPDAVDPPALHELDLTKLTIEPERVTAPAAGDRTAVLSLDPSLQRTAQRLFVHRGVTEGSILLMDLRSARMLVYASINEGARRDINVEATAPAASVFKVVTATALVAQGISPDHKECYRGGHSGFEMSDLIPNERRDKWCATLGNAVGRSLNVVMGRLAMNTLTPETLGNAAKLYGFGTPMAFDVPVQPSTVNLSEENQLEFARTAAGFWNTTLSPMHALLIPATIANKGVTPRPVIVSSVTNKKGKPIYRAPAAKQERGRVMTPELAEAVAKMMEETFTNGTAHADFYNRKGQSYLPSIRLAGKTGSLTNSKQRYFTWLVGYAGTDQPEVAYAVLVNNGPKWKTKAPLLTREILRAYYAAVGAEGVTAPSTR